MKSLGSVFKYLGDLFYGLGLLYLANVCYERARKLGANMEWKGK